VHRSRAVRSFASLTLVIALAGGLAAKGQTTRLVISGPDLPQPVETTDPKALSNVWGGSFIAEPAPQPDAALPRYLVTFYVQPPRDTPRPMYGVTYVRDPQSGEGFIYLPGRPHDPSRWPGWPLASRRARME
jgi:hypothetical protein